MKKSTIIFLMLVAAVIFIVAGVIVFKLVNKNNNAGVINSKIKVTDGIPKLFIDGKETNSSAVNVYYYPPQGENHGPAYGDESWIENMKTLIDRAVANNSKLIILNVWWSDLDRSTSRPKNVGDNLDFAPLDAVFNYAGEKGAHIIPSFALFPFDPDWWLKENNFPPYNKGKVCDFCETDSAGNVYNNASMNSDKVQQDFGGFIQAVVEHYKDSVALAGWLMGVGATGEDNYGPNYIVIRNPGNINGLPKIENKPMMYTDYSPFFEKKFGEWLKEKYGSDQSLQKIWNDKTVSLESFKTPKPDEMFAKGKQPLPSFPDPADIFSKIATGTDGKESLTRKGLDFYDFRNEMRRKERKYFSDLIRKIDSNHILLFGGASDDLLGQQSIADGIAFSDGVGDSMSYYLDTDIVKRAAKLQKIAVITKEHPCDAMALSRNGECESPNQVSNLKNLGKLVKCTGGIFGYNDSPYSKKDFSERKSWLPPVWSSDEMATAAKSIGKYKPENNCACPMASEIYSKNNCSVVQGSTDCKFVSMLYGSLCNVNVQDYSDPAGSGQTGRQDNPGPFSAQKRNESSPSSGPDQGKCGDGTCDQIEKSSGMCPEDC